MKCPPPTLPAFKIKFAAALVLAVTASVSSVSCALADSPGAESGSEVYEANAPGENPSSLPLFNGHGCDAACDGGDRVYVVEAVVETYEIAGDFEHMPVGFLQSPRSD